MGFDLMSRHGGESLPIWAFPRALEVAEAFEWKPEGTIWKDCPGRGGYLSNDFQRVTDSDAKALALGLRRALDAYRIGRGLALTKGDAEAVKILADYAAKGGFLIG